MYIERHITNAILRASAETPVIMLCGQRQVGKSTLLFHIKEENRTYLTFDDISVRRLAENDPELFFDTYKAPLLIDEFQRVPSLLLTIKKIVDELKLKGDNVNGLFWLTGSQKFSMMKNVSESLAGRISIFDMAGLTRGEINKEEFRLFNPDIDELKEINKFEKPDVNKVYEYIFRGSMPEIIANTVDRERYYMNYINTYLERDIHELSQVGKLDMFYDFLVAVAARTGQSLVYEELSRIVGVSAPTIREWISILERSGVIYILKPYHNNINKRIVKTPKVYFLDTGLAAYLCRWPNAKTIENGAMNGSFFETFVVSEIVKNMFNSGTHRDLYYYRDIDKKEIDLLIVQGEKIYPIEIKKNKQPDHPDKNFSVLKKLDKQIQTGLCICLSDVFIPYNKECYLCPVTILR